MPKLFLRIVAFLLVPCLLVEPTLAATISQQPHFRMFDQVQYNIQRGVFTEEALAQSSWLARPIQWIKAAGMFVRNGRQVQSGHMLTIPGTQGTRFFPVPTIAGGAGTEVEILKPAELEGRKIKTIFWDWGGTLGYWPTGMADGAAEFLKLSQELGVKNVLVTSAPRDEVDTWIQTHGIGPFFAEIICPADKANPIDKANEIRGYLDRHQTELSPAEAVGMGDDPVKDLAAFKQAGITSIAVLIPKSKFTREQLLETNAAALIRNDYTNHEAILQLLGFSQDLQAAIKRLVSAKAPRPGSDPESVKVAFRITIGAFSVAAIIFMKEFLQFLMTTDSIYYTLKMDLVDRAESFLWVGGPFLAVGIIFLLIGRYIPFGRFFAALRRVFPTDDLPFHLRYWNSSARVWRKSVTPAKHEVLLYRGSQEKLSLNAARKIYSALRKDLGIGRQASLEILKVILAQAPSIGKLLDDGYTGSSSAHDIGGATWGSGTYLNYPSPEWLNQIRKLLRQNQNSYRGMAKEDIVNALRMAA